MNHLRLASLFVAPALLASLALACGEISDPTKKSENTATVSGALTGTSVPDGAHVALVWKNGEHGGVVVGADVPIVDGKFTMNLVAPPDAYFFNGSTSSYSELNGGASPPPNTSTPEPTPAPPSDSTGTGGGSTSSTSSSSGGANVMQKIGIRTEVSGGITQPLSVAVAGFVVYLDTNGNGTLDLTGDYAGSADTLLGGNKELILTYLKGGGSLEYEKLRDKSGILPVQGYNLAWDQGRWLPLGLVELQIASKPKLPNNVCSSSGSDVRVSDTGDNVSTPGSGGSDPGPSGGSSGGTGSGSSGSIGTTTPPPPGGYPKKGDPYVHCYNGGQSFYYDDPANCPPPPAKPVGLCSYDYEEPYACATPSYSFAGDTPPDGWPCDYVSSGSSSGSTSSSSGGSSDAGSAPDSGI